MFPTLHLGEISSKKCFCLQKTAAETMGTEAAIFDANTVELTLGLCTYLGDLVESLSCDAVSYINTAISISDRSVRTYLPP